MPSEHQHGSDNGGYESDKHRLVAEKNADLLKSIKPERMETAQAWATASSEIGAKQEVIDHFVSEIKRLRD